MIYRGIVLIIGITKQMCEETGLDFQKWFELVNDVYCLTIKDIKDLRPGEKLDLLILDRNVLDIAYDINEEGVFH